MTGKPRERICISVKSWNILPYIEDEIKKAERLEKNQKKVLTFLAGYGIIVKRSREQDAKLKAKPKRTKKALDKPKEMW